MLAGKYLEGKAMPAIVEKMHSLLVGRKIIDVGYVIDPAEDAQYRKPWPYITLDDDQVLIIQADDESNAPGAVNVNPSKDLMCECDVSKHGNKRITWLNGRKRLVPLGC